MGYYTPAPIVLESAEETTILRMACVSLSGELYNSPSKPPEK